MTASSEWTAAQPASSESTGPEAAVTDEPVPVARAPVLERRTGNAPGGMFASMHVYNYRLYFFGQSTSVAGTWMQNIAVSWVVLQLTHSAVALGMTWAARYLGIVLLGPWGGLIADRSDLRRLLTVTQTCAAALSFILAVLSLTGHLTLGALLVIVVLLGLVNVFDGPARQSFISNLVGRDRLANAIALNSIAMNTARIVGPGVGGALIATLGITPCFFVNAFSFGTMVVSLLVMRTAELVRSERETRAKGQIRAALRYIVGTPTLLAPLVMVFVTGMLTWEFPVTLPLVTTSTFHGDATVYGALVSCLGAGSIVGAMAAARRRRLSVRSLSWSSALWGALILAAAAAPTLPVLYVLIALVGAGAVTFNSAAKTMLQLNSAPQLRGRVMAIWSMLWQGTTVVGAPIVGTAAGAFGARYGLVIGGLAAVVVGVAYGWGVRRRGSRGALVLLAEQVPDPAGDGDAQRPAEQDGDPDVDPQQLAPPGGSAGQPVGDLTEIDDRKQDFQ